MTACVCSRDEPRELAHRGASREQWGVSLTEAMAQFGLTTGSGRTRGRVKQEPEYPFCLAQHWAPWVARMKLADFVVPEAILPELRATTKEEAIRETVDALRIAGCVARADAEDVVRAVLRREGLGTTGAGNGVAFPEARHPAVGRTLGTIALSHTGVDFDAVDGGPVHILFLVISPPDRPAEFLRAEEMISRLLLGHDEFRGRLRQAATREEVVALIAEADRDALWEAVSSRLRPTRPPDTASGV